MRQLATAKTAEAALRTYDEALGSGDGGAVSALVSELLAAGADPVTVLTDVVAAAQREVGLRWQRGEWTVAQEHAATALAITATKAVAQHVKTLPVTRGRLLVACAEREWHALPAMIIECAARSRGWETTLLGASTSPMRLNQYVQDQGPEAVAVSCSVLGALPTSRRFIEAATAAGVPVVVGGPAFGSDDVRARALGATAWAPDAHGALAALDALPAVVPPAAPLDAAAAAEQAALELNQRALLATMLDRWSLIAQFGSPDDDVLRASLDVAQDVVQQALNAVAAALLTGDVRTVSEASAWIVDVLGHRGIEPASVAELGHVLTAELRDYPLARALVVGNF